MGKKQDWAELEKWNEINESKKVKYGIDITDMGKEKSKLDSWTHKLNVVGKTLKIGWIIVLIILIFIFITIINIAFSNMKNSFYVDVKKDIETRNFCKVKLISKDVVEAPGYKNENGTFYFEMKKIPDVKFKVIKNYGKTMDDFDANFEKYLFENWKSDEKRYFKTDEYIEENEGLSKGLLKYRIYIEIENDDELLNSIDYIIDYLEYAENWNKETKIINNYHRNKGEFSVSPGNINIKIKDKDIYISTYPNVRMSNQIKEKAIEEFNKLF